MSTPSSSRTTTVLTAAAVTVLGGLFAYAVYFDYRRRNDSDFRKKLRACLSHMAHASLSCPCAHPFRFGIRAAAGKEKKKVTKQTQKAQAVVDSVSEVSAAEVKEVLYKIRAEELPATPDEKEVYFMSQVQAGDQLVQRGQCSPRLSPFVRR